MKVYELNPKVVPLLSDHTSGFYWAQDDTRSSKYRINVVFTQDLGRDLAVAFRRIVALRKLHHQLMRFKTHGYVMNNMKFHLLVKCKRPTEKQALAAKRKATQMVERLRTAAKQLATQKRLITKYGPDYKGPKRVIKRRGSRGERTLWVWSFQNKELKKRYEHIFSFIDEGVEVGKSRRLFADSLGLRYECLQALAAGKIKAHRGWTLIGKPERVTHRQAIGMKVNQLSMDQKAGS